MSLKRSAISLLEIGEVNRETLLQLKNDLEDHFNKYDFRVQIDSRTLTLEPDEFNPMKGQYDGSLIMDRLIELVDLDGYFRTLGITEEDLFTEGLNFIFGLAMKPQGNLFKYSGAALISVARLRESFYGKREDVSLFRTRALKEAMHELGHTFDLDHCRNYCVMRFSNTLGETDAKPATYCESCHQKLSRFLSSVR